MTLPSFQGLWLCDFHGLSILDTGFQLLTRVPISTVTKQEVEEHFSSHGAGTIKEIKLMNGFGFIEYEDMMDARDVVPGRLHSSLCADQLR